MLKGLYTSYNAMINEQHRMDVVTNNLANANTTGFKKDGATSQAFNDVLAFKIKDLSEGPGIAKRLGTITPGVKVGEDYVDYSQGGMKGTENPFDMALSDNGFFAVQYTNKADETSIKYTRDGSFTMNTQGFLVTHDGDYVLNTAGARIKLDPLLDFRVDTAGNIMQGDSNAPVATLRITDFEDYNYLRKFGENMYETVDGFKLKESAAKVYGGFLETSNISVVSEMVNMIAASRAYETNQKVIQTYDGSLDISVNQLGKL